MDIYEPITPELGQIVSGSIAQYDERNENEKQREMMREIFRDLWIRADHFRTVMSFELDYAEMQRLGR